MGLLKFRPVLIPVFMSLFLAACADPGPPIEIRPGITSATDLDRLRPPSGVTYRFSLETKDVPIPVTLTLRSQRRSARVYDYIGTMAITLPASENNEEIGNLVAQSFGVKDVRFRGNDLVFPVNLRTDNRFRSLSSKLLLLNSRFEPHDCLAVLGTCKYTSISEQGQAIRLVSETTESGGVWRSETRPDPAAGRQPGGQGRQRSIYSLDRNGVLLDLVLQQFGTQENETVIFRRK